MRLACLTYLWLLLLTACAVLDWQQGYHYKPFSRYLLDQVRWAQTKLP